MTTAHRTTWRAAIGGDNQGGNRVIIPTRQFSALDLPGHLQMKSRDQKSVTEIKSKNFKQDFKNRQLKYQQAKEQGFQKPSTDGKINSLLMARTYTELQKMQLQQEKQKFSEINLQNQQTPCKQIAQELEPSKKKKIEDESQANLIQQQFMQSDDSSQSQTPFPQDADYKYSSQQQSGDDQKRKKFVNMLNSDDSEDEDQALMLEYEKIKKQRQEQQKRKLRLKAQEELKQKEAAILDANPAMSSRVKHDNHAYSLTRKWHEQTVFKNQARKQNVNKKKTFINDTVRSDFHRKFLNKYIL